MYSTRYEIPKTANGTRLIFVCSVNGHCNAGQRVDVSVLQASGIPDPKLDSGVCPKGFTLCADQSKQTDIQATVATLTNVPWLNTIGMDTPSLKLSGTETRASIPWASWKSRQIPGKRCRSRPQNTNIHRERASDGIDWGTVPTWEVRWVIC